MRLVSFACTLLAAHAVGSERPRVRSTGHTAPPLADPWARGPPMTPHRTVEVDRRQPLDPPMPPRRSWYANHTRWPELHGTAPINGTGRKNRLERGGVPYLERLPDPRTRCGSSEIACRDTSMTIVQSLRQSARCVMVEILSCTRLAAEIVAVHTDISDQCNFKVLPVRELAKRWLLEYGTEHEQGQETILRGGGEADACRRRPPRAVPTASTAAAAVQGGSAP